MARWWLLLATVVVALGLGGTLTLAAGALSDEGSSSWSCAGATVLASAVVDDGRVVVQLTVRDDRSRAWQVEDSYGAVHPLTGGEDDSVLPSVALLTGDLDDGTSRRVAVRPEGTARWCRGAVDAG